MTRRRRYLTALVGYRSQTSAFLEVERGESAACPEAARITDEEAQAFFLAARQMDFIDRDVITERFRKAGLRYPPEFHFSEYRLARFLFHQWENPEVREAFFRHVLQVEESPHLRIAEVVDPTVLHDTAEYWGPPAFCHLLRVKGRPDLVQPLLDSLGPKLRTQNEGMLLHAKRMLYRFLTDAGPAQVRSRWEQQKVNRLIRLREVQLRSMRRSLRKVKQEHREVQARLRELARSEHPELRQLAAEWAELRTQERAAEQEQKERLAELNRRQQGELSDLRAKQRRILQDYQAVLALRQGWLPATGGGADGPRQQGGSV